MIGRLTLAEAYRLVEGWRDPEVTLTSLVKRHRLSARDVRELKATLGVRQPPGPTSHQARSWAIRARRRAL